MSSHVTKPLTLGLLLSSSSVLVAPLTKACADPAFPARIACVCADRPNPAATQILPYGPAFEETVTQVMEQAGVNLIALCGFTRLLSSSFTDYWRDRLLTCHYSLLPAFKGLSPVAQALKAKATRTGVTLSYVRAAPDSGPIILQAETLVSDTDTLPSVTERLHTLAATAYPAALRLIGEGRVNVYDEDIFIAS